MEVKCIENNMALFSLKKYAGSGGIVQSIKSEA